MGVFNRETFRIFCTPFSSAAVLLRPVPLHPRICYAKLDKISKIQPPPVLSSTCAPACSIRCCIHPGGVTHNAAIYHTSRGAEYKPDPRGNNDSRLNNTRRRLGTTFIQAMWRYWNVEWTIDRNACSWNLYIPLLPTKLWMNASLSLRLTCPLFNPSGV